MVLRASGLVLAALVCVSAGFAAAPTVREAVSLMKSGRHPEALKVLDELVGSHPDNSKLRLLRAKTAYMAGKPEIATKELAALGRDPVVGPQATALLRKIRARLAAASPSPSPSPSPGPSASPSPEPPASPSPASPSAEPSPSEEPPFDYGGGKWRLGMDLDEFTAAASALGEGSELTGVTRGNRTEDGAVYMPSVNKMEFAGKVLGATDFAFDGSKKLTGALIYDTSGPREQIDERSTFLVELLTQAYGPPHVETARDERTHNQVKYWVEWTYWCFPQVPIIVYTNQDPEESSSPNYGEVWVIVGTHPPANLTNKDLVNELRTRPPLPRPTPDPSPAASPEPGSEEDLEEEAEEEAEPD